MTDSHDPIRVCFVIDRLSEDAEGKLAGGTERQLQMLINAFNPNLVQTHLCLLRDSTLLGHDLEAKCSIVNLHVKSLFSLSAFSAARSFAQYLRRERIEIVHAFFPDSTYFSLPTARIAGVRHAIRSIRNLGYGMKFHDRILSRVLNWVSCVTIANCSACRDAAIRLEGTAPERVTVIPNAIDYEQFVEVPALQFTSDVVNVCVVANLRPIKRLEILLQAAALLFPSHPELRVHLVGNGPQQAELSQQATKLGIASIVQFHGSRSDIPQFLRSMHICVMCSESEGLSNSILEYMAAGRAIVVTAVGGNVELIRHEVDGLLVSSNSVSEMAAGIERLLNDKCLAIKCAQSARDRVQHNFTESQLARSHEELYRQLCRGRADLSANNSTDSTFGRT